jgi:type I restriction enzyme M protein
MTTEDQLFQIADATRSKIDKTEQKDHLAPIIFLKMADESEDNLEIEIPDDHDWAELRKQEKDIAKHLEETYQILEEENEIIKNSLVTPGYSDETPLDDKTLRRVIALADNIQLGEEGEAWKLFRDFISRLVEAEGRDGGMGTTPDAISKLMATILPQTQEDRSEVSFHSPTVGMGGTASEVHEVFGENSVETEVTGQEINPGFAKFAEASLILKGTSPDIRVGDSLSEPQFTDGKSLTKFDYVVSDPPFSIDWKKEELEDDEFNRFFWTEKLPRKDRADYAFLFHALGQLEEDGKAVFLAPQGMLFRKHESKFREALVDHDLIEALISLPKGIFRNVGVPATLMVLNKDKPSEREGKIFMMDANQDSFFEETKNVNKLTEEGIEAIRESYYSFAEEPKVSRIISNSEIRDNSFNLNMALYIDTTEEPETGDLQQLIKEYEKVSEDQKRLEEKLQDQFEVIKDE